MPLAAYITILSHNYIFAYLGGGCIMCESSHYSFDIIWTKLLQISQPFKNPSLNVKSKPMSLWCLFPKVRQYISWINHQNWNWKKKQIKFHLSEKTIEFHLSGKTIEEVTASHPCLWTCWMDLIGHCVRPKQTRGNLVDILEISLPPILSSANLVLCRNINHEHPCGSKVSTLIKN